MKPTTVLFLCEDNASLSPLAEAYFNHVSDGRLRAFSAGPQPAAELNPAVAFLLAELGIDARGLGPKSWEFFALPHAPAPDRVVFLTEKSAGSSLPCWPHAPERFVWPVERAVAENPSLTRLRQGFRRIRIAVDSALQRGAFRGPAGDPLAPDIVAV